MVPQGFSAIGVGRSKMSARRQAASAMLAIFENVSPELVKVDSSEPSQPSPPLPSPQTASERPTPSPEMEEGEVPSDAQVKAEKEELFFIDRHPDLDLEETTQTPEKESDVLSNETSTVKVECSIVEPVVAETDTQDTDARPPVSCNTYDKESIEGSPVEMQKDNLPSVPRLPRIARTSFAREGSSMDHVAEGCLPVMKRKRSLEVETNECNVQEEEKLNASYFVPPRKRTKSIPKDFSVRMQIRIFCDYSEEVMEGLRKLAEAHMMADISIQMYSAVDLPKYVLIGRNMAAEVTVVKEEVRKHPGAVLAALAFGVGAKSQEMWVERAKHLARGLAADRSPMMLVLNQDPAVIAMGQKGVIEVAKPSDNLVEIVERMIGLKQEGSGM